MFMSKYSDELPVKVLWGCVGGVNQQANRLLEEVCTLFDRIVYYLVKSFLYNGLKIIR